MPAAPAVCRYCRVWPIALDDAICGLCGEQIGELKITLDADVVAPGDYKIIQTEIRNPTCSKIEVDKVEIVDSGGQPCGWAQIHPSGPVEFKPGETRAFEIVCDVPVDGHQTARIRLESAWGYNEQDGIILCQDVAPTVVLSPRSVETWQNGPTQFHVKLCPAEGFMRVRRLSCATTSWLGIAGNWNPSPPHRGRLVSREHPLDVTLEVNRRRVQHPALGHMTPYSARLTIHYGGPNGEETVDVPVELQIREQPEFLCPDQRGMRKEFSQTDQREVTLTFQNGDLGSPGSSRGPYRIRKVRPADGADWQIEFRDTTPGILPIEVRGGESKPISFLMDLRRLEVGNRELVLAVDTDLPEGEIHVSIPVRINALKPYLGKLVIDFGTTNSCAALVPDGAFQPQVQRIDQTEPGTTSATAISYQSVTREPPVVKSGNQVRNVYSRSAKVRLKRLLGEAEKSEQVLPSDSNAWVYRDVWRIVADYLREIRRRLEHTHQFTNFVLTHPASCSLDHFRNMKLALKEAFPGNVEVQFLQEPLAALVPFLFEQGMAFQANAPEAKPRYTVAAFDIGGGTTDVTLVDVQHIRTGGLVQVQPSIRASWGVAFGGENLSEFLNTEVELRCKAYPSRPSGRFVPSDDAQDQNAAEANRIHIQRWAEDWKVAHSNGKYPAALNRLDVYVRRQDGSALLEKVEREVLESIELENGSLVETYEAHVTEKVGGLLDRLKDTLKHTGTARLDFLQLSGKSSQIPAVRAAAKAKLESGAAPTVVFRADELKRLGCADLKECVVYGAALWFSGNSGTVTLAKQEGAHRTTSRLGRGLPSGFHPMIELDEVVDPIHGVSSDEKDLYWNGRSIIGIHENLSDIDEMYIDGVMNSNIKLSEQFSAGPHAAEIARWAAAHPGEPLKLRLRLRPDLKLEAWATLPGGCSYRLTEC